MALKRIFTETMPPVSSTKTFTGHTTSASGSIEAVICLLAMHHHFIPANLRWQHQMPDGITPSLGEQQCTLKHVVCNAFGFGGNDSSLILSAVPSPEHHVESQPVPMTFQPCVLAQVEITDEAELADIRHYVKPLEARRMGKLMKSALLSSLKVLEQSGIARPDAIITATSLGCLENSELLLKQIQEEGEGMLKPTYFMQSTHNTIGSAIAIHLKCHGYNTTYTQGPHSLEWALRDAQLLLMSGKASSVLVGLHEETTTLYRSLMEQLGETHLPSVHSIAMILTCGK
jgi:3-oxoacyl-(acyl-carrier-protein) synthase